MKEAATAKRGAMGYHSKVARSINHIFPTWTMIFLGSDQDRGPQCWTNSRDGTRLVPKETTPSVTNGLLVRNGSRH